MTPQERQDIDKLIAFIQQRWELARTNEMLLHVIPHISTPAYSVIQFEKRMYAEILKRLRDIGKPQGSSK